MRQFTLDACNREFLIQCTDLESSLRIEGAFGSLISAASSPLRTARSYHVCRDRTQSNFRVSGDCGSRAFDSAADLLFYLDKEITLALQHLRPDLLFLHAAVIGCGGRAVVLSAPAGTGKSTLTCVALDQGLDYFSDELAPIDLRRLSVHAYPRAVFLKSPPPPPHALPSGTMKVGGHYYVKPAQSPVTPRRDARVAATIFLRRDGQRFDGLRPISAASAATRVVANALNLLAHPSYGLDAAVALSQTVPAFELDTTDLTSASMAIRAALSG